MHVESLKLKDLKADYDLILAAVGYETRARYALSQRKIEGACKMAIRFNDRQLHDFKKNEEFFKRAGFELIPPDLSILRSAIDDAISRAPSEVSCLVDISSLNRLQIATVCYSLLICRKRFDRAIDVDFIYSYAEYSPPSHDFGPIRFRGPVIPQLSGWTSEPDLPIALVLGIGYESDIALGLAEEIEPGELVLFRPTGHDIAYDKAIDSENKDFLERLPRNKILEYNVFDPFDMYVRLMSVVGGLQRDCRTTVVPLGPKIFSLCSILCGLEWLPQVAIWRVSAAEFGEPMNRIPGGRIGSLRLRL